MTEIVNACFDSQDERDLSYAGVAKVQTLPESYYINDNDLQDQNRAGYPYGCVFFSNSQGSNIMNFIEKSDVRSTGKELCEYALEKGLFDPKAGAKIGSGPNVGKALGYLSGYARIETLEEIKNSIYNNRPVQCGSNKLVWSSANKDNEWTISAGDSYGHSIILVGYNDRTEKLTIKQSYNKRKDGLQYLNYSDFGLLYPSKYSLFDKEDNTILLYKKKLMEDIKLESAKKAVENGFFSGERPQDKATREETASMVERMYEKLKKDNNLK